jgi:hypothetical protein
MVLKRPTAAACFMMIVASPDQNEHMSRSGLACWMAAMCEVKSVTAELGEELQHELDVRYVPLEHDLIRLPAIVTVGIVVADACHRLDPFEVLGGELARHDGLDFVVHALEGPLGIGHGLFHALLRRPVPGEPRHFHLLGHGAEGKGHSRGDAADHDLDLVLEDELAIALHCVLGGGLFLDDQLHGAPENAPRLVHAVGPPLRAAQPRRAHRRGDTRADGDDADLDRIGRHTRLGLRPGHGGKADGAGGGRPACHLQEVASRRRHVVSLFVES